MKVRIGADVVTLTDQALLGTGGEAQVFRHGGDAVKIYHPVDASLPAKERKVRQAELDRRLAKVAAFPRSLPAAVVAPRALVFGV